MGCRVTSKDDPELRARVKAELLYPVKVAEGVDSQGLAWVESLTYWSDGTVERVLWRENRDRTWTPFSNCPKCGSVNHCQCRARAEAEYAAAG